MYNIPQILNESIEILKGVLDNTDDLALLNALNSKMTNLIGLKGCLFKQYSKSNPMAISYYGMSFLNSGMNKDYMISCINNYLLPFVETELQEHIEEYKQRYEYEEMERRRGKKNAEKEIQEELDRIRVANLELANPNYTGLYREAEQIDKIGFGSLFIKIGELGDYLDNIVGGDKGKKELFQKLKDIYDGSVAPSIIAGDGKRKTLKNIPIQTMLYTDFENLYNEKIRDYFLACLKTGMARRCFIYMPANKDVKLKHKTSHREKDYAFEQSRALQDKFKMLYRSIREKTIYSFSVEAMDLLDQYQNQCIDYFNESKDNTIIKLEKKESYWKITKLAVVYSVIDNPVNNIVTTKYVQMAIDFYNLISPGLKRVIEKRKESEIEQYARYLADNKKRIVTRTDLRNLNLVAQSKFKRFFEEHFDEVKEELQNTYNLAIYDYTGDRNMKAYQLVKIK